MSNGLVLRFICRVVRGMSLGVRQKLFEHAKRKDKNQETKDWPGTLRRHGSAASLQHENDAPEDIAQFGELYQQRYWEETD